jgi:hypothetical protein
VAIEVKKGDAETVKVEGATCFYVLSYSTARGPTVALIGNGPEDRRELRSLLEAALAAGASPVLLRAGTFMGKVQGWQSLDPSAFVGSL